MERRVTLRQANQQLSRYVREVEDGAEVVITRRGRPVARLMPVAGERRLTAEQAAALERTLARMERGWALGGRAPSRDSLHER
jgi:prevent-host-death family protein